MCEIGWLVRWRFPVVSKVLCICVGKGKVFKVVFVGSRGQGFHTYLGRARGGGHFKFGALFWSEAGDWTLALQKLPFFPLLTPPFFSSFPSKTLQLSPLLWDELRLRSIAFYRFC